MTRTFDYVKYEENNAQLQEQFREKFKELEALADSTLENGRYKSLFKTGLEETYMWCGKAIRDKQIAETNATHQEARTNSPE